MSPDLTLLTLRRHLVRLTPIRRTVLDVLARSFFALSRAKLDKPLPQRPRVPVPHPAHV